MAVGMAGLEKPLLGKNGNHKARQLCLASTPAPLKSLKFEVRGQHADTLAAALSTCSVSVSPVR